MKRPAHFFASTAAATACLAALSGCSLPQGPPGTVASKARQWSPATKANTYYLTVRTADGSRQKFQVSFSDFKHCGPRARYPACTSDH